MHRRTLLRLSAGLPWLPLPVAAHPAASLRRDLRDEISRIEAIDTHEHLLPEPERVALPVDVFTLASHYAMDDLTSAGLPNEARARLLDPAESDQTKWDLFAPWWPQVAQTGYGQALRLALHDIYDIETLDRGSLRVANERTPGPLCRGAEAACPAPLLRQRRVLAAPTRRRRPDAVRARP